MMKDMYIKPLVEIKNIFNVLDFTRVSPGWGDNELPGGDL